MLPTNVKFYSTIHIIEAPGGLRANIWARPQDVRRDKSAAAMTIYADDADAAAISDTVADAIVRGISACIKFQCPWRAMDVMAAYLEHRVGAPPAAGSGR